MEAAPLTLIGRIIRLEPMKSEHAPLLAAVGLDDRIWRNMVYGSVASGEDMQRWVDELLARQARGTDLPFTVFERASNRAIGATRIMTIAPEHRSVEIGGTWYAPEFQGSAVNPEAKFLLLRHVFETWGVIRVQIKTDIQNLRSQRAIEKLGAVREGVLRNHMILPGGRVRTSVLYSILADEWPAVKARLVERLGYEPGAD